VELVKSQRNDLFEAVHAAGLDPCQFKLAEEDADRRLSHRWSESYFVIGGGHGHFVGRYVVGDDSPRAYEVHIWTVLVDRVRGWLADVKRDLETPDLWAELEGRRELLAPAAETDVQNTPFTSDEQAEIARQLRELKQYIHETYSLSEDETLALQARLDYLEEAAARLGRIDWRNVAAGAMFTILVEAVLPPDTVRGIFVVLFKTLAHFFGHGMPELPSG
jgi:hypothetical protein